MQPYQDRGVKDKERFKREFRDYREKVRIGYYDNPANANGQGKTEAVVPSPEEATASEPGLSSAAITLPAVAGSELAGVSEQVKSE